ncbi:cytochrome b/b6 domain-containing protein [Sphingomonas melonis]|jgi:Ni/Fe-hydrogenase b-type cytochrome subunit|uniref:Ni/Fe-hydrogenase b-type cytochrome subunit n=1 Tax=Sphingomonas melonis TaxID=152682 RepID=A0A7Y9FNK5_9SPHN|nr:cytochrome b/b6 domain-containing protein [Sphingomonas melonis]NYD89416.1 Ni/Fe-hydrogenase b-type cytochrome subunit [Sphingomonas melonis]
MDPSAPGTTIFRHALATRVWHWINAIAVFILLGSGLGISNAHPRLYWGRYGANFDHAWAQLPRFPAWITIPANYNLAISRRWHLLFALVLAFGLLAFMIASLINRHFARHLRLKRADLSAAHLAEDVRDHLNLRFHDADDPGAYNSLQKWSYILVLFLALPLMILTGLALSPGMDAAWPWLLDLFGGRQSARSLHFVTSALIGGFVVIHLTLVILAGAGNELRSMITGRWTVPPEGDRS